MPPVGDQACSGRGVRLFHEAGDGVDAGGVTQRIATLDIAIAGFRPGGLHAEGDEPAGPRGHRRDAQRAVQRRDVGDGVVGGKHPLQAVGVVLGGQQRGRGHGGGTVAANRLQHQARVGDAGSAQLLRDQEAVLVVADDDRRRETGTVGARGSFLHQAAIGGQRPKLLREALAGDRP